MGYWLEQNFHIRCVSLRCSVGAGLTLLGRPTVLYDKAPSIFQPTALDEKHSLFQRLHDELDGESIITCDAARQQTICTEVGYGTPRRCTGSWADYRPQTRWISAAAQG